MGSAGPPLPVERRNHVRYPSHNLIHLRIGPEELTPVLLVRHGIVALLHFLGHIWGISN